MTPAVAGLVAQLAEGVERSIGFRADAIPANALESFVRAQLGSGATIDSLLQRSLAGDPAFVREIAASVAVGETYFFRQPEHFRLVAHEVVPTVSLEKVPRLRAWSAACATGEEAYSLAATLARAAPAGLAFSVLGTDLLERNLSLARAARYRPSALRADEPLYPVFETDAAGELSVRRELVATTTFAPHNLLDPAPAAGELFDLILCRNALVYFTAAAQRQALAHLAAALAPEGFLLLGPMDAQEPPPGLVPFGRAELQAFRRTRRTTTRRRRPSPPRPPTRRTKREAPRREAPPLDPIALHLEALGCVERGEEKRASVLLERVTREAPAYVPGLLELALLVARRGETHVAASLMRDVLHRTEGRPLGDELEGPTALPVGFYRDGARAYLRRQGS